MSLAVTLAEHLRQVYTGGNWSGVNLRDTLSDISYEQAVVELQGCNSIARLLLHIDYYVGIIATALRQGVLSGKDADSWLLTLPADEAAWLALQEQVFGESRRSSKPRRHVGRPYVRRRFCRR